MAKKTQPTTQSSAIAGAGRFEYEGLDRVLHEKARLGLMTCLAGSSDGLTFNELKRLCNLTDGNLSRHLKHLSDAGLVDLVRDEKPGRPQTICHLTNDGRKRFAEYLSELQRVIGDASQQIERASASNPRLASD